MAFAAVKELPKLLSMVAHGDMALDSVMDKVAAAEAPVLEVVEVTLVS